MVLYNRRSSSGSDGSAFANEVTEGHVQAVDVGATGAAYGTSSYKYFDMQSRLDFTVGATTDASGYSPYRFPAREYARVVLPITQDAWQQLYDDGGVGMLGVRLEVNGITDSGDSCQFKLPATMNDAST